jgi:monoamine oxidase
MPTLFTVLSARHRPTAPPPPLTSAARPRQAPRTLLETELPTTVTATASRFVGRRRGATPRRRVIVVGAGFAGLCAAYELTGLGYDVEVYEARNRVGGRVHSLDKVVPNKVMEGGAELIGSNHRLWLRYRHHFGLKFTPVMDYANSPVRFGSRTLSFEETKKLSHQMQVLLTHLNRVAKQIKNPFEPWTARNAAALDARSLESWLRHVRGTRLAKLAVAEQLAADNGVAADCQSFLGVLAMVKGGGLQRYWDDTEVYRCEGGNQQLAECFQAALNRRRRRVFTCSPVREIAWSNGVARVTIQRKRKHEVREAEDVILTVPPSVWRRISFADETLRQRLHSPPQMGTNVKYLMRLRRRFWQAFASSPTLTEDGPVDITWETTESDEVGDYGFVAFSGACDAEKCVKWRKRTRRAKYVKALKAPYPGIAGEIEGSRFMNWPKATWTRASYYFPKMKEVGSWGPFWNTGYGQWLHFAGEHTCFAFVGYMEGALQSGYRLSRRLALRDRQRLRIGKRMRNAPNIR